MNVPVLLYGVTGYTGRLILEEMLRRGLRPIVAGRNAGAVRALAHAHGVDARIAALDDAEALNRLLSGIRVVMHCAGPFSVTSAPMLDAALRAKAHYLDITGEITVFERCAKFDSSGRAAGISIIPGVGFDVVPSDCLAAHLKSRLPSATALTLAFVGGVALSHGTATTMVKNLGLGGAVRRNGEIVRVPIAWESRDVDFGDKVRHAVSFPWGDVSTAFHSTGIPNITVYTATTRGAVRMMRVARPFIPLIASPIGRALAQRIIDARGAGPDEAERKRGRARFWGEVTDGAGRVARSRYEGPDGYTMTAITAVSAIERLLAGGVPTGFRTPSKAFGADFALSVPDSRREDLA